MELQDASGCFGYWCRIIHQQQEVFPNLHQECDKISHITCPLDARMATYINVIVLWVTELTKLSIVKSLSRSVKVVLLSFDW